MISPCLFNYFLSDCPTSLQLMSSYADDLTVAVSHPDITRDAAHISDILSADFAPIQDWAETNKLTIAPEKSTVTLFTPWTSQCNSHPSVIMSSSPVPLDKNPKILGVVFDPLFTFASVAAKASGDEGHSRHFMGTG